MVRIGYAPNERAVGGGTRNRGIIQNLDFGSEAFNCEAIIQNIAKFCLIARRKKTGGTANSKHAQTNRGGHHQRRANPQTKRHGHHRRQRSVAPAVAYNIILFIWILYEKTRSNWVSISDWNSKTKQGLTQFARNDIIIMLLIITLGGAKPYRVIIPLWKINVNTNGNIIPPQCRTM